MQFVTGEPALLVGETLIIGDLHIGIEHEFSRAGIKMPSQLDKMTKKIDSILKKTRAKKLIILGDVKHNVPGISWQELKEVPKFLNRLAKKTELEIVPGNHDGGLAGLVPNIKIHKSSGMSLELCYLTHGHTRPSRDVSKAKHIIMGHSHPQVEFRDKLGYRWLEPVWLKARFLELELPSLHPPEIIVMPAFNPFAGGMPVNRNKELLGPVAKRADLSSAEAYLLDGTFLGKVGKLD